MRGKREALPPEWVSLAVAIGAARPGLEVSRIFLVLREEYAATRGQTDDDANIAALIERLRARL